MGLFSKEIATFEDLFLHQLQDVYYAENQIIKALPKLIADKEITREQVVAEISAVIKAQNLNTTQAITFLTNIANGRLHTQPEVRKAFEDMVPLKRLGTVDEIKGLALYLASPASSFMTGACIPLDGGATAG